MGNAAGTRGTKGDNPENGTRTGTDSSATADSPPDGGAPGEKTSEEPEKTSEEPAKPRTAHSSPSDR